MKNEGVLSRTFSFYTLNNYLFYFFVGFLSFNSVT